MHSGRKVNLGRRNALAMLDLQRKPLYPAFGAPGYTGPVLKAASITAATGNAAAAAAAAYTVSMTFASASAASLHFAGAACCTNCCTTKDGSAVQVRVANASSVTGFTWQRSEVRRSPLPRRRVASRPVCSFVRLSAVV